MTKKSPKSQRSPSPKKSKLSTKAVEALPVAIVQEIDLLDFGNLEKARNSVARIIKEFSKYRLTDDRLKAYCFAFNTWLAFYRVEIEREQVARLRRIEDRLEELGENQNRS